jgi:tetratricopeptide (TPR) repeat protein
VVDELAIGISERLLLNLAGAERAQLIRHRTESLDAIRLVEQGRAGARQATLAGIEQGRQAIEEALRLDPDYALAHLALADVFAMQMQLQQRDTRWWRSQVEPLLERALALDDELPGAYLLRSELRCAALDWAGCRADIERALTLEPGSADVQAAAASFHMTLGSRPQAIEHALRLVQIEPELPRAWDTLTMALLHGGRAQDALSASQRSLQRFPQHWPAWRAQAVALEVLGRCSAGVEAHERALAAADAPLEVNSTAASLYVCADRRERAVALLREFETLRASGDPIGEIAFAATHLALGQKAAALDALEAMQASGDLRLRHWLPNRLWGIERLAGEPRLLAPQVPQLIA